MHANQSAARTNFFTPVDRDALAAAVAEVGTIRMHEQADQPGKVCLRPSIGRYVWPTVTSDFQVFDLVAFVMEHLDASDTAVLVSVSHAGDRDLGARVVIVANGSTTELTLQDMVNQTLESMGLSPNTSGLVS